MEKPLGPQEQILTIAEVGEIIQGRLNTLNIPEMETTTQDIIDQGPILKSIGSDEDNSDFGLDNTPDIIEDSQTQLVTNGNDLLDVKNSIKQKPQNTIIAANKEYKSFMKILLDEHEIEDINSNNFFISKKTVDEIFSENHFGISKEKMIELLREKGFKSVIRINSSNYKIIIKEFDEKTKKIIEKMLLNGNIIGENEFLYIEISDSDIREAIDINGGDGSNLQGFFNKINKGFKKSNPTFKRGFTFTI